ncbi:MAG: MBL fold metallo-hydrolase [Bacteroidota bacterium]|nr:MBL fold metallo-hydrolase [Bacteroidota bacterium]
MNIKLFTFNPFSENTYLLYDDSGECVIVDPGCSNGQEERALDSFIAEKKLQPVLLLNTHCHIDHILGNRFVSDKYGLLLEANAHEESNLRFADVYCQQFGIAPPQSPAIEKFLDEGDKITFGDTELDVLFSPGHSAGHVVFVNPADKCVIGGDVLFRDSIGRTDLPGGDHATLLNSIREKLWTLPDDFVVYPGHGPSTTIGYEKSNNPFLNGRYDD